MKYLFDGPTVNLGRFGFVKKGDVLELTPQEADSIRDDKRFKATDDSRLKNHKPGQFVTITAGMSADERAAAEKANKAEKERLAVLEKENDSRKIYVQTVREMTYPQLEAEADRLNSEAGRQIVQYDKKKTARGDLINIILSAQQIATGEE